MKNRARFLVLEWENLLKKTVTCAVNALSIRASLEPRLMYLTSWLRQTLWLPCYISLHVALPVEVEWVGEPALKPEPPLNCIMWTQWLKLAIVNTCTCDFVRQRAMLSGEESGRVCGCALSAENECEGVSERYNVTGLTTWCVCVCVWLREVPYTAELESLFVVRGQLCCSCGWGSRTVSLRGRHSRLAAPRLLLPVDSC